MFDEYGEEDATCANGMPNGFAFNEDTYQWIRTCAGSDAEYDVQCVVSLGGAVVPPRISALVIQ